GRLIYDDGYQLLHYFSNALTTFKIRIGWKGVFPILLGIFEILKSRPDRDCQTGLRRNCIRLNSHWTQVMPSNLTREVYIPHFVGYNQTGFRPDSVLQFLSKSLT